MSNRQTQFSGTREVLETHRFDADRLHEYMVSHVEGFHGQLTVRQFKGGQSNPTYLLESASGKYVLRRKPPGKLLKSAHAVDREYRAISALYAADFPVPRPYVLCKDDEIIGTMFYIMEFVEGRIFWEFGLPGLDRDERRAVYDQMNRVIADLHCLDPARLGLADFGVPGNYFERQISRWSRQYLASQTDRIDDMHRLMEWLPENIPDEDSVSLVHGDFRLDNLIFHPREAKIIAVLDWELSTIGHPLGDFTYNLMAWQMPDVGFGSTSLVGADLEALGIPDEETYVTRYCERTGRTDGIRCRNFYAAYNFFRLAAILQGIAGRVRDGTAASVHARSAATAVAPLAAIGWRYARQDR